ncbi:Tn3 transposase DDE domain protein [Candidatus Arcanobacter lacustris]|uniref:Tn3 transposase DDE domain protein n=1 Tax=Candidatus Arcanibacter lacustris TaxID=1607817 RepID=A0A0F5MQY8_9RICK|nr:Tn3 transposase DDE domain protein [Candidatus Arcanobacter lacustris]
MCAGKNHYTSSKVQQEINKRFSTINLIDILQEADFRINFSNKFSTIASREGINGEEFLTRLLLCVYAIGSNTGLKRVAGANLDANYQDLLYFKRRYISVANIRAATTDVINAIIEIRDPKIWGIMTTGCACDSKKISCWDQNLISQWHTRYRGRGVMIYWHVDQNSACIYSQIKTCTSSEVGSMINGFLKHDSKMDMNKTYTDTHGQSVIGFAISHLLHFELLPRIKGVNKQKLYYASKGDGKLYPNLDLIFKGGINWKLIEKQYNEVVRYMAALKTGTIETEVMIKHLSTPNNNHPVYKALTEIGNAVKTIFLCKYISSQDLRIEITQSLNIVERVNGIMGFIFYGKLGEISSNNTTEQELSIVCLHLLQVCMVYINTLLIQEVLADQILFDKLTKEDKRSITPLIHSHINPYGLFPLDLNQRLIISNDNIKTKTSYQHKAV